VNKIKAQLSKIRSTISVRTYKKPIVFIIMRMVLINLFILAIAAWIAVLIDDSFSSWLDAFTNGSVKWMLTPNAILTIDNPPTMVLAVVVLIVGMVLFSGTIIALTTNAIKEYFQKKQSGGGKIYLEKHIAILNWNNKVPELVADLLHMEQDQVTIVILADIEKSFAEKMIANAVALKNHQVVDVTKLNILVKKGDPLLLSDLQDISLEKADSVLIMNQEGKIDSNASIANSDLNIIKIILGLGRVQFEKRIPMVAEVKKYETKSKIITMTSVVQTLKNFDVMPICFDRRLGQIISQTIIESKIEDVYLSLFSFEGAEIYRLKNTTFDECLSHYSHAIPLSQEGNDLFVLSLSNATKTIKSTTKVETKTLKVLPIEENRTMEVFIVGKNNKLAFILDAFKEYELINQSRFNSHWIEDKDFPSFLETINNASVQCTIVLLSDEFAPIDALDANVIDNLIYLQSHLKKSNVHIIVELLDPKNDHIIKDFNILNTIISNKITSLLMSKLALIADTSEFYDDLLTISPNDNNKDEQAITIKSAKECINEIFPIAFTSQKSFICSLYESYNKSLIPIGLFHKEELRIFSGNLEANETLLIDKNDSIVLMKL
jgi:uncharacterized membrane protein YgdD (TMEM256/DUF423 family)